MLLTALHSLVYRRGEMGSKRKSVTEGANKRNTARATDDINTRVHDPKIVQERKRIESKAKRCSTSGGRKPEVTHLVPLLERSIWHDVVYFLPKARVRPAGKRYVVRAGVGEFTFVVSGNRLPRSTSSAVRRMPGRRWAGTWNNNLVWAKHATIERTMWETRQLRLNRFAGFEGRPYSH